MIRHFIFVSNNNYLTFNQAKAVITTTADKQNAWVFQLAAAKPMELIGLTWTPVEVSTECQNNPGYFDGIR